MMCNSENETEKDLIRWEEGWKDENMNIHGERQKSPMVDEWEDRIQVYKACVLSTLLYCSESWTIHAQQERKLNTFHMRCLRRIFNITWQDKVPNSIVLNRAGIPSMYTLLKQRRLRWLGNVVRMDDGQIPKDLLYGELMKGKRPRGRPQLRYKDIYLTSLGVLKELEKLAQCLMTVWLGPMRT
ncbi:hypothetical protein JRQ81_002343 [Phrynocephalus forsythii]|uniref:Reverse transcriptase n=1 Tax=Phrynocephalus forsythii TaxID=171643 RepID=A0A9Q0XIE9_9SAUR|nr:hypothetical protein JRQ81_002343 [Phrynocephalus forsythii]